MNVHMTCGLFLVCFSQVQRIREVELAQLKLAEQERYQKELSRIQDQVHFHKCTTPFAHIVELLCSEHMETLEGLLCRGFHYSEVLLHV